MTFGITREQVECVINQQFTQDDYSRGIGPHKTEYNIRNNYSSYEEAFWMTALVLAANYRQNNGNFDPIDLGELMESLKKK